MMLLLIFLWRIGRGEAVGFSRRFAGSCSFANMISADSELEKSPFRVLGVALVVDQRFKEARTAGLQGVHHLFRRWPIVILHTLIEKTLQSTLLIAIVQRSNFGAFLRPRVNEKNIMGSCRKPLYEIAIQILTRPFVIS